MVLVVYHYSFSFWKRPFVVTTHIAGLVSSFSNTYSMIIVFFCLYAIQCDRLNINQYTTSTVSSFSKGLEATGATFMLCICYEYQ